MCFDPVSMASAAAFSSAGGVAGGAAAVTAAEAAVATWGAIGSAMQIGSLGMQAINGMQQSQASADAANYQAAVQRNNAQLAEIQAQDAIERGNQATQDHARKVSALKGAQTASMAARGLDLSEGTPLAILTDTDLFGAVDKNTIKSNAEREAWAYRAQASNATSNADLYSMQAKNQSPLLTGAGTLLAGAGQVSDKWYRYKSGNSGVYIG